jgi:tRNA-modifying protein YgfZ
MRDDWKKHLLNTGAEFEGDRLRDYGNAERERSMAVNGDVICDLSHRGLLGVRGKDAQSFLQGQFGNDIREVTETRSQLSSYSSPKGRAYAVFRVLRDRDAYLLEMNPEPVEPVRKRLSMFVMRAEVVIENAEDSRIRFGLSGPSAEQQLEETLGAFPVEVNEVLTRNELSIVRVPTMMHPRFEFAGEIDACRALWNDLNVHSAPVGPAGWRLLDILAGIPAIYPETSESFVPQMINLHALNGISFNKGCYPGQEVVARMHYLGKLKRRMYRLAIEGRNRRFPAVRSSVPAAIRASPTGRSSMRCCTRTASLQHSRYCRSPRPSTPCAGVPRSGRRPT